MRASHPLPRCAIGAVAVALVACGGATDIVTPPPPPPPSGLTLVVVADAEDVSSAQQLGWQAGIPDVELLVQPADSSAAPRAFRTGPDGRIAVSDLLPRLYTVQANRWLGAEERGRLATGDDAIGFAGRSSLSVAAETRTATIAVPASRRRSMVISEWAFNVGFVPPAGASYPLGGYFEVYNNGDTTIYLDRMAIGKAVSYDYDIPSATCAAAAQYSNDPLGVWTLMYQVFPGGGADFPLPPGRTAVIATDAIDHGAFYPNGLDLSTADFEFIGPTDVDNPAVPNMIDTGFNPDPSGHGMFFGGLGSVAFLSRPLAETSLPKARYFGGPNLHPRIPADLLLDVVAIRTKYVAPYPECPFIVHSAFDRLSFGGRGTNEQAESVHSVERKASPVSVGSRVVLLHTRTGDFDFRRGQRSVGSVPSVP